MTQRTDVHSPTNLVTEDYEYLFAADLQSPWAVGLASNDSGREFLRQLCNYGPTDPYPYHEKCSHCGANVRYTAWLRHIPTGYTISVGETCMDNRFERSTVDFQKLRKAAQLDREQQKIRKAIDEFIAANPDLAWMDRNGEIPELIATNPFIQDVTRKLRLYGNLSEKQVASVRRVIEMYAERALKVVQDAIEHPAAPVVEGRIVIIGEVLTVKVQYGDYGSTIKMLVRDDRGFKVWGTVPNSITSQCKGERVEFTATVTKSKDDETFGFFKRPAKAKVL